MREIYCGYASFCEYYISREDIVRERRGSYNRCVVGYIPSFVG
jgi:hypothetical protein